MLKKKIEPAVHLDKISLRLFVSAPSEAATLQPTVNQQQFISYR